MPQGQPKEIKIKASDEKLKGEYSNMMQINHHKEEFILDFISVLPPIAILNARIIVSPMHFKRMYEAMEDNLRKYEERFGKISPSQEPTSIGFKVK